VARTERIACFLLSIELRASERAAKESGIWCTAIANVTTIK